MPGGIFLIGKDEELVEMAESSYDSEDILQRLLARYPNLLPGDQIGADSPRKWLLICREMGVPDAEESSDRLSVDHLFLDQDDIPDFLKRE